MTSEETWELAKKLFIDKKQWKEFKEIFQGMDKEKVFELSISEVEKIVNSYKEKKKIHIGDIVVDSYYVRYLVLDEFENDDEESIFYLFSENGCVERVHESRLTKTEINRNNCIKQILCMLRGTPIIVKAD